MIFFRLYQDKHDQTIYLNFPYKKTLSIIVNFLVIDYANYDVVTWRGKNHSGISHQQSVGVQKCEITCIILFLSPFSLMHRGQ